MGVMFKIVQNDPPSLAKYSSEELSRIYARYLAELCERKAFIKHLTLKIEKLPACLYFICMVVIFHFIYLFYYIFIIFCLGTDGDRLL